MKTTYLAALLWLAATTGARAQFNNRGGPPSASEMYGAGPSTPPQMFQKTPPATAITPNTTANSTANGTSNGAGNSALSNVLTAPTDGADAGKATPAGAGNIPTNPLAPDLANVVMPSSPALIDNTRILAPGDQFVYQVLEDHDAPVVLFVNIDGQASPHVPYLPQLRIKAAGATLQQLAANISGQLTNKDLGYYEKATVLLAPYHADNSRGHVNIEGQVKKPGQVPIPASSELTLYGALTAAGGFTEAADGEHVHLIHNDPDPQKTFNKEFNIQKDMNEGRETNVIVQPGDFIKVLSKTESYSTIAVTGEVNHQLVRPVSSNNPPKILDLILDAGFTSWSSHTVRLVHAPESKLPDQYIDMDDILVRGKQQENITLSPGDQIIVKANWFSFR